MSDDVAGAGPVTLKLSDFWGSAEEQWIVTLVDKFQKKYPNVTIQRTREDWGQLTSTLNLQLQDASGPDIASANNGWSSLGTLARGNLVLNLDPYAQLYGWNDLVPTTIARQNKFTTDFTTIGEGSWFGTPVSRASLIGIYYNAQKLQQLGSRCPRRSPTCSRRRPPSRRRARRPSATAASTGTRRLSSACRPCTARRTRSTTSSTATPRSAPRRPASRMPRRRSRSGHRQDG